MNKLRKGVSKFNQILDRKLSLCMRCIIVLYRTCISPFIPARCRFLPTCSAYGIEALETHGLRKGLTFLLRRIVRCHPWGGSGYDPVPPKNNID